MFYSYYDSFYSSGNFFFKYFCKGTFNLTSECCQYHGNVRHSFSLSPSIYNQRHTHDSAKVPLPNTPGCRRIPHTVHLRVRGLEPMEDADWGNGGGSVPCPGPWPWWPTLQPQQALRGRGGGGHDPPHPQPLVPAAPTATENRAPVTAGPVALPLQL